MVIKPARNLLKTGTWKKRASAMSRPMIIPMNKGMKAKRKVTGINGTAALKASAIAVKSMGIVAPSFLYSV